eukprot:2767744-Amphidinium_carterae.1
MRLAAEVPSQSLGTLSACAGKQTLVHDWQEASESFGPASAAFCRQELSRAIDQGIARTKKDGRGVNLEL